MKHAAVNAVVLALCLFLGLSHAQPLTPPAPLEAQLQSVVDEMIKLGESAAEALVHQFEEIVVEPQQQLEQAVEQLEARRESSPQCVDAQEAQLAQILDTAHEQTHQCGVSAAHESAEIVSDVNKATQQLVYGGYSLGRTYQKCKSYKNAVLRQSCMAKFYVQATVYLVNARSSLKTISQSTNDRIPAVIADGNACTHHAADDAIEAIDVLNAEIDACIALAARR
ncbi:hypothetical protein KR222_000953 [Zaprionus bogoriensis]|nr:hypothetical protein KR222_000953 [Zaprionus bogoriensis]